MSQSASQSIGQSVILPVSQFSVRQSASIQSVSHSVYLFIHSFIHSFIYLFIDLYFFDYFGLILVGTTRLLQ